MNKKKIAIIGLSIAMTAVLFALIIFVINANTAATGSEPRVNRSVEYESKAWKNLANQNEK